MEVRLCYAVDTTMWQAIDVLSTSRKDSRLAGQKTKQHMGHSG